jgi:hypothetical protein
MFELAIVEAIRGITAGGDAPSGLRICRDVGEEAFLRRTSRARSFSAICSLATERQASSSIGSARKPFEKGNPEAARQIMAPDALRRGPIAWRTYSRFGVSPISGSSVHLDSRSSNCPATSTTKSTSRVRSR